MSGGYFDYKQYHLDDIADELDHLVKHGMYLGWSDGPVQYDHYAPDIEQIFLETAMKLRELRVYVHRIDWLVSGDDGESAFRERLKEELEKLNG